MAAEGAVEEMNFSLSVSNSLGNKRNMSSNCIQNVRFILALSTIKNTLFPVTT